MPTENFEYVFLIYSLFFFSCLFFSILINSIFLKFARTLGIRNEVDTIIRWASTSKPALGGFSFYMVFLISFATFSIFFQRPEVFQSREVLGLMAGTSLAFMMGLADDAYNTRPLLKFFVQVTCGVILIATGTSVNIFEYEWLNYCLTVLWVIAMMNSINMLDNMDAITTVVSIFIFVAALISMRLSGHSSDIFFIIFVGLVATLCGFLFYNWHPSKIFMGDTGSQFLGIVLAFIGIRYFLNYEDADGQTFAPKQLIMTGLVFILPVVDTTCVVINRIAKKQSPFIGGKDHTTHHLSYLGLSDSQVAFIFIGISVISIVLIYVIMRFIPGWSFVNTLIFGSYFFLVFLILFYITRMKRPE